MENTLDETKLTAIFSVTGCRSDIEQLDRDMFLVEYDYDIITRKKVLYQEYFLVLNYHEHCDHMRNCYSLERCRGRNGYEIFMHYWQYLGVDGNCYVYRLHHYRG